MTYIPEKSSFAGLDNDVTRDHSSSSLDSSPLPMEPLLPMVQFSSAMYYVDQNEGEMIIDVCKLGDPFAECPVLMRH